MKPQFAVMFVVALLSLSAHADELTIVSDRVISAFAQEISGESAMRNLEEISKHHRMRGSRPFHAATELVIAKLKEAGLSDVHVEAFPADGTIFYGTQRSRPAWNAERGELWEIAERDDMVSEVQIVSWESAPIRLAQDSASADVTAELIDIGSGLAESDYAGKDVQGKIVLTSSQPGEAARLAVDRYGAAGIVSYAQNQRTAWWGENEDLIRWGHLDTFAGKSTFGFMLSPKEARSYQKRLERGEKIKLHAIVMGGQSPGSYEIATAIIPGTDPALKREEIVFSCHLDHPRPGANDNASGCATILEIARSLSKLVASRRVDAPRRTIRFVWPAEIEGTLALLNGRPDLASRIKAALHLDMVGGGAETKAIFHVTRGPASQPSFIDDVAREIGAFVNAQSAEFAMTGAARHPLTAPTGGKEPLLAQFVPLTLGSDHQVYGDSSFGIPAIYLNDWPDRYIHTNFDTPSNLDATKLKRAAFIAGLSGYILANLTANDAAGIAALLKAGALRRSATMIEQSYGLIAAEAENLKRFQTSYERAIFESMRRFFEIPIAVRASNERFYQQMEKLNRVPPGRKRPSTGDVYHRNPDVKGPMPAFGFNYLEARYGRDRARALALLKFVGLRGSGDEYAYEALNLVDGTRTTSDIRNDLSAIYGPVSLADVEQYLAALDSIGVIKKIPPRR